MYFRAIHHTTIGLACATTSPILSVMDRVMVLWQAKLAEGG